MKINCFIQYWTRFFLINISLFAKCEIKSSSYAISNLSNFGYYNFQTYHNVSIDMMINRKQNLNLDGNAFKNKSMRNIERPMADHNTNNKNKLNALMDINSKIDSYFSNNEYFCKVVDTNAYFRRVVESNEYFNNLVTNTCTCSPNLSISLGGKIATTRWKTRQDTVAKSSTKKMMNSARNLAIESLKDLTKAKIKPNHRKSRGKSVQPEVESVIEDKNSKQDSHLPISREIFHEYCVIGSGPAGLQLGYHLQRSGRDYVIYERNNISGSFFRIFPRHRKLISINKRFTGKLNPEFHLRHDWNSLLSDDPTLLFKHFSTDFFPHADSMVKYLNEYQRKLRLNVEYNVNIRNIRRVATSSSEAIFQMSDTSNQHRTCRYLVIATGLWKSNSPHFKGSHMVEDYETIDLNAEGFQGKNVLILGRGNAAFETADSLYGHTNLIHMVSRSRARLAWNTHYVGDLRALNNGLLDTYQLKSLDGLLEASVEEMTLQKKKKKLFVRFHVEPPNSEEDLCSKESNETKHHIIGSRNCSTKSEAKRTVKPIDNFSLREGYDRVIRCLGFTFDFDIFDNSTMRQLSENAGKYPKIKATFESQTVPDLHFAGTIAHSLDYRRSSGGFIHGFRYNVRALHHMLEWKNHGIKWASIKQSTNHLLNLLIKRINEASGPYQMFQELADIFIFTKDKLEFVMIEEYPVSLLPRISSVTGHKLGPQDSFLVVIMEYGPHFSGPDKDTFRSDRATGDPLEAHKSNFLHPVFYYYDTLPSESSMLTKWNNLRLPKPSRLHHILEDFLTDWTAPQTHILPLRRFLETILQRDLRHHFANKCILYKLTNVKKPIRCKSKYAFNVSEAIS